ncbi:hypothetical protein BDZ45DRAFT_26081 [Acephala macrosclerotiorum]|nr:hypothetical protein BDZ45DRAFT_26081 [Acephala macrosclerotiorum]
MSANDSHAARTELESNESITLHEDYSLPPKVSNSVARALHPLHAEVNALWRKRRFSPYVSVRVLLAHWGSDDVGVINEVQELERTFSILYRYEVERYEIPEFQSDRLLKGRVLNFLECTQTDTLLIFYYACSSFITPDRHDYRTAYRSKGHDLRNRSSSSLLFGDIQSVFEETASDLLQLYDTCHSVPAAGIQHKFSPGLKVVLAGSRLEGATLAVEQSFTKTLIQELILAAEEGQISVNQLHNQMGTRLDPYPTNRLREANGGFVRRHPKSLVYESNIRKAPISSFVGNEDSRGDILLSPLTETSSTFLDIHTNTAESSETLPPKSSVCIWPHPSFRDRPDVVIGLKLEDSQNMSNYGDSRDWSRAAPKSIKTIQFGFSTLNKP